MSAVVPQVSVVVPHHGDPLPTRNLCASLRAQQGVELEVVVVDDASPQPLDLPADDPGHPVRLVRRERNGGFGSAVNSGVAVAESDLVLILNSDVEIVPTFVADLVSAATPWQPAVTGPAVRSPSGAADPTARHFPTVRHQVTEWLTPLARWRHHRLLREGVGHDTRATAGRTLPVDWLVGAALLIPTAHLRAVGGFDERFFMNSEEIDLQRRLRARGLPSVYLGEISLVHVGGGSSDPDRRRAWLVASRLAYARKWGGARRLAAALRAATLVNLCANLARATRGTVVHPWATARGEWRLLRAGGADG